MEVDESLLTGEAEAIPKPPSAPVSSGTFCLSGSAYYIAERVGGHSTANQMTQGARQFRRISTPLQREIYLVIQVMLLVALYFELLLVINAFV